MKSLVSNYLFVTVTILMILLFFVGLPDLDSVFARREKLPEKSGGDALRRKSARLDRKDLFLAAVLTVVFAIVDFAGLGNTGSPQTFEEMHGKTAYITLTEDKQPSSVMFFPGVGVGEYEISCSTDGENFQNIAAYSQNYVSVLKWEIAVPSYSPSMESAKYFRITADAASCAWLGEIAFFDANGEVIGIECSLPLLCDEQEYATDTQTFMNSSYFDEIYHARTAWENLNGVYPYEISHPPLGKLIIALGIVICGMTPFGWRFSGTLFGVLMIPAMYLFLKKMFRDRRICVCGCVILGTDFMHYVQTRIATIDTYAVFFILLMYLFMYDYLETKSPRSLALCGIVFGLGAASKWTCLYAGAGLAVIWVIDRIIHRKDGFVSFVKNSLFCIVFFVLIPAVIYYISYIPYGIARGIRPVFSREYFDLVIENQTSMFSYHSGLVAEHPYSSVWYQWLLDIRPILYYLQVTPSGGRSEFGAMVNPALCWAGLIAVLLVLYCAVFKKDRNAWFIFLAYIAQLLPWIFVTRLTFAYHYFPCCIFLILALGYIFSLMKDGTKHWKVYIGSLTALSVILFILFYPVLSGSEVSVEYIGKFLQWMPTWSL